MSSPIEAMAHAAERPEPSAKAVDRFIPETVTPPAHFLQGLDATRAGLRNPIELWDRELFSLRSRVMKRFGRRFVEITDPALMHQVLVVEADAFKRSELQLRFTRPLVGDGILAAVGDSWRLQRRAAAPCFRQQALDELLPAVALAADRAAASARASGTVDVMPLMMRTTFDVVSELLGVGAGSLDEAAIERACDDYLKGVGLASIAEIFGLGWLHDRLPLQGRRAVERIRREAVRAVQQSRQRSTPTGLIKRLAAAYGAGAATDSAEDARLRDSVIAFIAAGAETAAVALAWALHCVANDRGVQSRLAAEARRVLGNGALSRDKIEALDLHLRVIKEALRLFPPIALMQRTATRAVRIGEHDLSPGDDVVCAIYVMHRSERLWDRPAEFDPDRFLADASAARHRFAFLPFGAGAHACLGMPLAYMEMVGILATLTRQLALAPDASQPVQPVMRLTLRPQNGVRLRVLANDCEGRLAELAA